MTSNDSGVESSTDNDDCAPPPSPFPSDDAERPPVSSTIEAAAAATGDAEMSVVPAPAVRKPREFPVSLCLNSGLSDRIVFARPVFSELPGRKFKCTFELANPAIPGTGDGGSGGGGGGGDDGGGGVGGCCGVSGGDRFQTCLTPIQEYTEMLLRMEKKDGTTQTRSGCGGGAPCRVQSNRCRSAVDFLLTDSHKLCRAANLNNTDMLKQLLDTGVSPNCRDSRRRTPLHLAASKGYAKAVGLLLAYGANPNIKDSLGNIPLHLAACTHHMDVVTLLLKGGTDVSSRDSQGRSPLHLAQSKLRLLIQCRNKVSPSSKQTVMEVIDMLIAYFNKQTDSSGEAELLNAFQNRLKISDTGESVSSEIQDLLNNLSTLQLNK